MDVLLSGLIAAIISGLINLYGNRQATKTQKEIAKMQKDERLFYESQLNWANETRKLIAKFVNDCFRLNIVIKDIKDLSNKVHKLDFSPNEVNSLSDKNGENLRKVGELISSLNEEATMIRLYLFHKDNEDEKIVLGMIDQIVNGTEEQISMDTQLLNQFVDVARDYFDHQMKELKEKSA